MKLLRNFSVAAFMAVFAITTANAGSPELPKVEILGQEYYYYEIKKDDSIYGIARKFGWNVDELNKLNPHTVSNMRKGERLYYPVNSIKDDTISETSKMAEADLVYEPVCHLVRPGETVYSIAHLYGIPIEAIYESHPSSKHGIKAGETIKIKQDKTGKQKGKYLFYRIRKGDTLYGVARKFDTTVEHLLRANPGVSEKSFKANETIRVPVNSNAGNIKREIVNEERLSSVDSYKVRKNDTWKSISRRTGVDENRLKEFNDSDSAPKKNDIVAVPVTEQIRVEKEYLEQDPRSLTDVGRQEIYDDVHKISSDSVWNAVNVAILMEDPSSRRDLEFTRGFIIALDEMKDSPYRIGLKVIDGRSSTAEVTKQLDDFKPHIVISTADRNYPAFLADYGNTNNLEIINVFDIRNELYLENPSMVQLITPSNYFNDEVAMWLKDKFKDYRLLMIGNPDDADSIAAQLLQEFDESNIDRLTISDFAEYDLNDVDSYLVYSYSTRKEEAVEILSAVEGVALRSPLSRIAVVGRPNWITFAESMKEKLYENDVYIPSRFYYDPEQTESRIFTSHYNSMFGQNPLKSFPMFAVTGYDVARTFVPGVIFNGGDLNKGLPVADTLQTDVELRRVSNWGGFVNPVVYMLHYAPYQETEKIILK